MRTVVVFLAAVVLAAVGWFWWRGDILGNSPVVHEAAAPAPPTVLGDFEHIGSSCVDTVDWESVHARPWNALSQGFSGEVDACAELYRMNSEIDDEGDYYIAVVTAGWTTKEREDYWWPWDGRDDHADPIRLTVTSSDKAIDNVYFASSPAVDQCSDYAAPAVLEDGLGSEVPTVVSGTCGAEISRTSLDETGASWTLTRPEEWDVTVLSYQFKVAPGVVPTIELAVDRVGVEG